MERREIFPILAAIAASPDLIAADYRPRFFSVDQYELLDRVCEQILPADEDGGGAHEAKVAAYIDTWVSYASPETQATWRSGVAELQRGSVTDKLGEPFFERLKAITIDAFFQSSIGQKYVNYSGHSGRLEFQGCNHPNHK